MEPMTKRDWLFLLVLVLLTGTGIALWTHFFGPIPMG